MSILGRIASQGDFMCIAGSASNCEWTKNIYAKIIYTLISKYPGTQFCVDVLANVVYPIPKCMNTGNLSCVAHAASV